MSLSLFPLPLQLSSMTNCQRKVSKAAERTVSRAYGGSRCATCVRTR
jgi:ribosomal protein L34E